MDHELMIAAMDDWMQLLIAAVFIFGGIGQAIVKKIRSRGVEDAEMVDEVDRRPGTPTAQPRAPQFPTAQPLRREPTAPTAQARPPRQPARPAQPRPTPPLARPTPPQPTGQSMRPPIEQPLAPTPRPLRAQNPSQRAKPKPAAKAKPQQPAPETPLSERHLQVSDDIAHPAIEAYETEVDDSTDPITRPTRESLRYAIIMNEILSPPIALRSDDEGL